MADKDLITDDQRQEVSPGSLLSVQSGALDPLVEYQAVLQDGTLSLVPLDSHATGEGVVQPYPRSPKLLRKVAASRNLSEVNVMIVTATSPVTNDSLVVKCLVFHLYLNKTVSFALANWKPIDSKSIVISSD